MVVFFLGGGGGGGGGEGSTTEKFFMKICHLVQRLKQTHRHTYIGTGHGDIIKLTFWRRNYVFLNFSTPCI